MKVSRYPKLLGQDNGVSIGYSYRKYNKHNSNIPNGRSINILTPYKDYEPEFIDIIIWNYTKQEIIFDLPTFSRNRNTITNDFYDDEDVFSILPSKYENKTYYAKDFPITIKPNSIYTFVVECSTISNNIYSVLSLKYKISDTTIKHNIVLVVTEDESEFTKFVNKVKDAFKATGETIGSLIGGVTEKLGINLNFLLVAGLIFMAFMLLSKLIDKKSN